VADTLDDLRRAFQAVPHHLEQTLTVAVRMAGEDAATKAKQTDKFRDRTGSLRNSIKPVGPVGSFGSGDLAVTLSAGAAHASFVEEGTPPHVIRPKHRKALRWPVAGGFLFAKVVRHPGTRATHFLADAANESIIRLKDELLPQAVELAFLKAGFSR
jgi:hypothetical protein